MPGLIQEPGAGSVWRSGKLSQGINVLDHVGQSVVYVDVRLHVTRSTPVTDRALARENLMEAGYVVARVRSLARTAELALESAQSG